MFHNSNNRPLPYLTYHEAISHDRRAKPQCFDHGCNGYEFLTFSDLLKHQREMSGTVETTHRSRYSGQFTQFSAREVQNDTSDLVESPRYRRSRINYTGYEFIETTPEIVEPNIGPPNAEIKLDYAYFDAPQDMSFGGSDGGDVLEEFDFDSFLENKKDDDSHEAKVNSRTIAPDDVVVLSPSVTLPNIPQRSPSILAGDRGSGSGIVDQGEGQYSPVRLSFSYSRARERHHSFAQNGNEAMQLEVPPLDQNKDSPGRDLQDNIDSSTGRRMPSLSKIPRPQSTPEMEHVDSGLSDTDLIDVGGHENFREMGTELAEEAEVDLQEQKLTEVVKSPPENTATDRSQSGKLEKSGDFEEELEDEWRPIASSSNPFSVWERHATGKEREASSTQWNAINMLPSSQLPDLALEDDDLALDYDPQIVDTGLGSPNDAGIVSHGKRKRSEEKQNIESVISIAQQIQDEEGLSQVALRTNQNDANLGGENCTTNDVMREKATTKETRRLTEREDDIVEVIEECSPPRRVRSQSVSGYRAVDLDAYGGGERVEESLDPVQAAEGSLTVTERKRSIPNSSQPLQKRIRRDYSEESSEASGSIRSSSTNHTQTAFTGALIDYRNSNTSIEEVNIIQNGLEDPDVQLEALDKPASWVGGRSLGTNFDAQELNATEVEELNATEEEVSRAKGEIFKLLRQWTTCDPSVWTAEFMQNDECGLAS